MTPQERVEAYCKAFPDYPPLRYDDRWIDGMWMMGNNYKGSGYYGAYPPQYLKRIMALFPDKQKILHLFSGSLPKGPYVRMDSNPELDTELCGNIEQLSDHVLAGTFDLILADPPYTGEDALKYGTPMVNRNKVVKECAKIMKPGAHLVWLDQVLPMYRKDTLHLFGLVGVVRSTNHRFRVVSIWERVKASSKNSTKMRKISKKGSKLSRPHSSKSQTEDGQQAKTGVVQRLVNSVLDKLPNSL